MEKIDFINSKFLYANYDKIKNKTSKYSFLFSNLINIIELSSNIVISIYIRIIEQSISNSEQNSERLQKKLLDINKLFKKGYVAPSLGKVSEILRKCIDSFSDPSFNVLNNFKNIYKTKFALGNITFLLNDLYQIFNSLDDNDSMDKIVFDKSGKYDLLSIIEKLIKIRNDDAHIEKISSLLDDYFNENDKNLKLNDLNNWELSFISIIKLLLPILNLEFINISFDEAKIINKTKVLYKIRKLKNNNIVEEENNLSLDDYKELVDYQSYKIIIRDEENKYEIKMFPFLIIKENNLYYYKKSCSSGYQYYSFSEKKVYKLSIKEKFNHCLFSNKINVDNQELFWTDVLPIINEKNKIKANIPYDSNNLFIGRKKQISNISIEILDIPNRNGIILGPGGVGKTALMIEITKNLYNNENIDEIKFNNIIWCSAKQNIFNLRKNEITKKQPQFNSLDSIFDLILNFFEHSNIDEYDFDEKKYLVTDIIQENKILLILDNFESLNEEEVLSITNFFEDEIKLILKNKPTNFKFIITSRKLIGNGIYSYKLKGLDLKESKKLMNNIFTDNYINCSNNITEKQMDLLYKVTNGIPIIIKHSLVRIFENNNDINEVINSLNGFCDNEEQIVKFSFQEIFKFLENDKLKTEIIILLERIKNPISIRQISDIINKNEIEIQKVIPKLFNYQCIERLNIGTESKYIINDDIKILIKNFIIKIKKTDNTIEQNLIEKIRNNYTLEKQMDYTSNEKEIIDIFSQYIRDKSYTEADKFINDSLIENPHSIIIKFHYAKFLKEIKENTTEAIIILEDLINKEIRDSNIILLLIHYYTCGEFPNFKRAEEMILKLNKSDDEYIKLRLSEFYINWSSYLKYKKRENDIFKESERKNKYKDLSGKGIDILMTIKDAKELDRYYFLLSRGHFYKWECEKALSFIDKTLSYSKSDQNKKIYMDFKNEIITRIKKNK